MAHLTLLLAILVLPSLCRAQMSMGMQQILTLQAHREMGGDCNRPCNGVPKTCTYTFTVFNYLTMSSACGDCPYNSSHCYNDGCIPAGGHQRSIYCVNGQIPGPCIRVCEGDTIKVEVQNMMSTEAVTIHWHGMHQKGTPEMDGVPMVSQCTIPPNTRFTYKYIAYPCGIHMWHSHMGFGESGGIMGCFIVEKQRNLEPNLELLGYNVVQREVIIWHWFPEYDDDHAFRLGRLTGVRTTGQKMLINGLGPDKQFERDGRIYRTPYAVLKFRKGSVSRIHLMSITPLDCPKEVSIDGHVIIIIRTDTTSIKPITVDSIMINPGERFDCIIKPINELNGTVTKFWLRVVGHGICTVNRVHQQAIVSYDDSTDDLPEGTPTYENSRRPGRIFNPIGDNDFTGYTKVTWNDVQSLGQDKMIQRLRRKPTKRIRLGFTRTIVVGGDMPGLRNQINNVTYVAPASPCQTQPESCKYCTEETKEDFCKDPDFCACHHVIEIKKGDIVEVLVYEPRLPGVPGHPVHVHGYHFCLAAIGQFWQNQTLDEFLDMYEKGLIKKRIDKCPVKDTVTCPNGGYMILLFEANNPGYWLVHCHITSHMETGMAVVFKVGETYQMPPVPKNFPRCGNYPPSNSYVWHSSFNKRKRIPFM